MITGRCGGGREDLYRVVEPVGECIRSAENTVESFNASLRLAADLTVRCCYELEAPPAVPGVGRRQRPCSSRQRTNRRLIRSVRPGVGSLPPLPRILEQDAAQLRLLEEFLL
jgi:hypothetical protein